MDVCYAAAFSMEGSFQFPKLKVEVAADELASMNWHALTVESFQQLTFWSSGKWVLEE